MLKNYQICSRCVMDTSDPDIFFDEDILCNNCTNCIEESKIIRPQGEERSKKIEEIVKKIKKSSKNNKYDCLIGMSGGVDSSYLAYLVVELGLTPLALHMDNGWNSKDAVKNILSVCQWLKQKQCQKVKKNLPLLENKKHLMQDLNHLMLEH